MNAILWESRDADVENQFPLIGKTRIEIKSSRQLERLWLVETEPVNLCPPIRGREHSYIVTKSPSATARLKPTGMDPLNIQP